MNNKILVSTSNKQSFNNIWKITEQYRRLDNKNWDHIVHCEQ